MRGPSSWMRSRRRAEKASWTDVRSKSGVLLIAPSRPGARRRVQGRHPRPEPAVSPAEVHEVSLATEPECGEAAESVLECATLESDGGEVGILEEGPVEPHGRGGVHEIRERGRRLAGTGAFAGRGSRR